MNGFGFGDRPGTGPELLLRASECCLQNRNFDGCRKYVLQAQEATGAAAAEILAVVDVLSASQTRFNGNQPDWYAILGVNRYSGDSHLIRTRFRNFVKVLNPTKNKFPFSDEAFGLVCDAWKVLSNPSEKAQFDNVLKIVESESKTEKQCDGSGETTTEEGQCAAGSGGDETFWSACPYCYYVYEYYRVVEDSSVRCWNQNCKRVFQAVAVLSPPPAAVVSSGRYWCLGFSPIGFDGEEGKGFSSWMPFAPLFTVTHQAKEEVEKESLRQSCNGSNGDNLIEISDDSHDDEVVGTEEAKKRKRVGKEEDAGTSVAKPVMKRRKKSVARNSKKILGKGIRVKKDNTGTWAC